MADQSETIKTNAGKPKRASNDAGSVQQFDIDEQIEADIHNRRASRMTRNSLGIRFVRTLMPGSRD